MSSIQELLLFARELETKIPGPHTSPEEWMLLAGDFSRECLDGDEIRSPFAGSITMKRRGPFFRAVRILRDLSASYGGTQNSRLPEAFRTIFEILEEAMARPASRGAWRRNDPEQLDQLLPIAGRKTFDRDLIEAVKEVGPSEPLSLLVSDVDHFKSVNDHFGHPAGDETLKAVARLHDLVSYGKGKAYRLGGEEMAVLLPNCAETEAVATAERLRVAIGRETVPAIGQAVTVSIGASTTYDAATDVESFYKETDAALYKAKDAGRNRVMTSRGETSPTSTVDIGITTPRPEPPVPIPTSSSPPDIPPDVFTRIRRKAEADWPDNFAMRLHEETRQLEAYRQMYPKA